MEFASMGTVHASNIVSIGYGSMKCARPRSFAEKEQNGERRVQHFGGIFLVRTQNTHLMNDFRCNQLW
eukprot:scaffold17985_cov69-Skeletonema_marinoi.AAC.4